MKFFRSFEMPDQFEDNFNPKIMRHDVKPILEKVKENEENEENDNIAIRRDRYNTFDTMAENIRSIYLLI
jgi:hypothetical protein